MIWSNIWYGPTGAFFFGYTLNAMLGGVFYGLFLYKAKATLPRVVSAKLLINIVVNGLLGTLWYSMLYGEGFNAIFGVRMLANIGKVPVESTVLLIILPTGNYRTAPGKGYACKSVPQKPPDRKRKESPYERHFDWDAGMRQKHHRRRSCQNTWIFIYRR